MRSEQHPTTLFSQALPLTIPLLLASGEVAPTPLTGLHGLTVDALAVHL